MTTCVVIVGTLFGPKTIHGPFKDADDVNQWVSTNCGNQPYEVVPLQSAGGWTFTFR